MNLTLAVGVSVLVIAAAPSPALAQESGIELRSVRVLAGCGLRPSRERVSTFSFVKDPEGNQIELVLAQK